MKYSDILYEVQVAMYHFLLKQVQSAGLQCRDLPNPRLKFGLLSFTELQDEFSKYYPTARVATSNTEFPITAVQELFNGGYSIDWMKRHGYMEG